MTTYEFCVDWIGRHARTGIKVLDYGCGAGQIVGLLRGRGIEAYGCDVFYEGGDYSRSVPTELQAFISRMEGDRIPFLADNFDLIVSNQVFEHVPDMESAVREIARVLKPSGLALNLFPDRGVWREGHCGVPLLHRFRKGTRLRVYYAALIRALGIGLCKDGKPILRWAEEFCSWLDNWTYYRPLSEIRARFALIGPTTHAEEEWFDARLDGRLSFLPNGLKRLIARKFAGLTLISVKGARNGSGSGITAT